MGRAHGPRLARSWRARAAALGTPTDKGGGGGGCALRSAPGRPTSTRGRWTLHPRSLVSVAGGQRARRIRSCSDLGLSSCGRGGGRLLDILEMLKAKWTDRLGTTRVPKSRGWDMPRMRRGVGLRAGRHGEWHGPCSLRPKDSISNSPSRRTSCPRRPASSTISTTSARLRRRRRRSGRAGRPARQA